MIAREEASHRQVSTQVSAFLGLARHFRQLWASLPQCTRDPRPLSPLIHLHPQPLSLSLHGTPLPSPSLSCTPFTLLSPLPSLLFCSSPLFLSLSPFGLPILPSLTPLTLLTPLYVSPLRAFPSGNFSLFFSCVCDFSLS